MRRCVVLLRASEPQEGIFEILRLRLGLQGILKGSDFCAVIPFRDSPDMNKNDTGMGSLLGRPHPMQENEIPHVASHNRAPLRTRIPSNNPYRRRDMLGSIGPGPSTPLGPTGIPLSPTPGRKWLLTESVRTSIVVT